MIFNKSRKYDFPPEFSFRNKVFLECIEETKLLGIYLTPDLKWQANTRQIYLKAMSRMWLLRRLKVAKLEPEVLMEYFVKEIRPLTEHGVAIWNSGLTKAQVNEIEKIQKVALKIILNENYISYEVACTIMNTQPLKHRRAELCTKFAIKLFKSSKSKEYFTQVKKVVNTRGDQPIVREYMANTKRCHNAPHNYLARLLNENKSKLSQK